MPILNDPIAKLGLDRCKEIAARGEGRWGTHYCVEKDRVDIGDENHFYFREQMESGLTFVRLEPLRRVLRIMALPLDKQKEAVFRSYHNGNYHDGCDHFDSKTYARMENDPTEYADKFVQDCYEHFEFIWDRMLAIGGDSLQAKLYHLF